MADWLNGGFFVWLLVRSSTPYSGPSASILCSESCQSLGTLRADAYSGAHAPNINQSELSCSTRGQ